jgi:FMN phosphatase YigB (HAD superfamily)
MTVAILDLDGTLINSSESSKREKEIILKHIGEDADLLEEAEKHTLGNPLWYKWRWKGLTSAFTEDPYLWRRAQAEYLWEAIRENTEYKTPEEFSEWMFREATASEEMVLMASAEELIRHLYESGIRPVIVTNSSTEKGEKCAKLIGIDPGAVYGKAMKRAVEAKDGFEINGEISYACRPNYERILKEIMGEYEAEPEEVLVIGDIYTLDLSLPRQMGMRCILKANQFKDGFSTPRIFVDYAIKNGIYIVRELAEIKGIL